MPVSLSKLEGPAGLWLALPGPVQTWSWTWTWNWKTHIMVSMKRPWTGSTITVTFYLNGSPT